MDFRVLLPPNIEFGIGKRQLLPEKILDFGHKVLLVIGGSSFSKSNNWDILTKSFK
jgi:alcohol dehydrogenase YqhD (iron-dependent ADH family)